MLVEDPRAARCEILLITDDADHAGELLADLATASTPFLVTKVHEPRRVVPALARLTEVLPRRFPVIVMLDFEFLGDACEAIAARAMAMKGQAAVECLVTRPPRKVRLAVRLTDMGVFQFDPNDEIAAPESMLH
jgi:hypothetical protein